MDDLLYGLLSGLEGAPDSSLDAAALRAEADDLVEAAQGLRALWKAGLVQEENRNYSITEKGEIALEAERTARTGMLDITNNQKELGRRPDEPSQTSSSAPVPPFHIRVDRFGNPRVVPFTPEEKAKETTRQQNMKAMEAESESAKGIAVLPPEWFKNGNPAHRMS